MTAYFDQWQDAVCHAADQAEDDAMFLELLAGIEERVIRDVSLCTGDREFPEHHREQAMTLISLHRVGGPVPAHSSRLDATLGRCSPMLDTLHSFFHRLAGQKIRTAYGLLSDDPIDNVRRRDAFYKIRRSP